MIFDLQIFDLHVEIHLSIYVFCKERLATMQIHLCMNTSFLCSHYFYMEMMKSLSYFVTFPTVHTASVHSLTIWGYFYWLVSFAFCFRLRMYEKNGLLNFLSKSHANKLLLLFLLKQWLLVIFYGWPTFKLYTQIPLMCGNRSFSWGQHSNAFNSIGFTFLKDCETDQI